MNNILRLLSQKNAFKFVKVEPAQIPNDRFDLEKPLVKFVQETKEVSLRLDSKLRPNRDNWPDIKNSFLGAFLFIEASF